jgi:hypothetical protein
MIRRESNLVAYDQATYARNLEDLFLLGNVLIPSHPPFVMIMFQKYKPSLYPPTKKNRHAIAHYKVEDAKSRCALLIHIFPC